MLTASNAEEAVTIAAAHAGAIQLLVTDVIMPGQNGRVLAEKLVAATRASRSYTFPGTPIHLSRGTVFWDGLEFTE